MKLSGTSGKRVLRTTGISVHADEFTVVSIHPDDWIRLLGDTSLSPGGNSPYMIFRDAEEITLVLSESDFRLIKPAIGQSRFERGFRLITFTAEMDFAVVGFIAEVSRIMAENDIPILALSSFSRDHILVKQADLSKALRSLGPSVDEIC